MLSLAQSFWVVCTYGEAGGTLTPPWSLVPSTIVLPFGNQRMDGGWGVCCLSVGLYTSAVCWRVEVSIYMMFATWNWGARRIFISQKGLKLMQLVGPCCEGAWVYSVIQCVSSGLGGSLWGHPALKDDTGHFAARSRWFFWEKLSFMSFFFSLACLR